MRLVLSAGALALSMALAGCGGSSSSGGPGGGSSTMLATAVTTATTAVENIIPDTPTQGQIDAAESAIAAVEALDSDHGMLAGWKRTVARAKDELQRDMAAEQQGDKDGEADTAAMTAKLNKLLAAIGTDNAAANFGDGSGQASFIRAAGTNNADLIKPTSDVTDLDAPQAISGWNGMSYSVKDGMETTETVVYDNKGPQVSRPLVGTGGVYTLVPATDSVPAHIHVNAADDGSDTQANRLKQIGLSGLPANPNHAGVMIGTVPVSGTFHGVAGHFVASAGTIEVRVDSMGTPRIHGTTSGELRFRPGSATATVMVDDRSYMNLGWWLTTHDVNGIDDVRVAAWASGDQSTYTNGSFAALLGKATFQGIAVGKYTHRQASTIEGGHFNAAAKLEANFDNETMTGTIDNFMQDGQSIGNGWKVELAAGGGTFSASTGAAITDSGAAHQVDGAQGTFGNLKIPGAWQARFVGAERNDDLPGGVIGEFHIGQQNAPINMVGAFAAENQVTDQSAP